jgi:hypothetical protein
MRMRVCVVYFYFGAHSLKPLQIYLIIQKARKKEISFLAVTVPINL